MPPRFKPGRGRRPKKTAMRDMGAAEAAGHEKEGSFDALPSTPRKAAARTAKRVAYALLHWDDLPAWRRDNGYILGGYRPTSHSYAASLASVVGVHNESVNIWTHLGGAVVAALLGLALYVEVPRASVILSGILLGLLPAAAEAKVRAGAARLVEYAAEQIPSSSAWLAKADSLLASALDAVDFSGLALADNTTPSSTLVLTCFAAGAVACLGMSATYHALSNHSPAVARWGNKLDYSGIVFLIVGSYVPTLYYGFFCHPRWLTVYMYLINILGLACLTVSWLDHFRTPEWRPYRAMLFVGLGASGVVPIAHGLLLLENNGHADDTLGARYQRLNERMGLNWVLLQGFFYVFGAFIYASRWPERWRPGRFDIWGSSHQIFHVFVLLAAAAHLRGVMQAYLYHHNVMGAECPVPLLG